MFSTPKMGKFCSPGTFCYCLEWGQVEDETRVIGHYSHTIAFHPVKTKDPKDGSEHLLFPSNFPVSSYDFHLP